MSGRWCMNKNEGISLISPLCVFSRQNNPAGDGNGHAEVGHDIQRGDPDVDLCDLGFEQTGGQAIAKQLFKPIYSFPILLVDS